MARLHIALVADPELPVPPKLYGGIERVVHFLAENLTAAGHQVVLFAHPESRVSCELVPYAGNCSASLTDTVRNAATIASHAVCRRFDVVHSFGRLQYLTPIAWHPVKKLMSYQRPITHTSIARAVRLFGRALEFSACSNWMTADVRSLAHWHVVYNGVPLDRYGFCANVAADAPVVFLGRLEHIKGPHLAIEAARRAGRRLVLAGNVQPGHEAYFEGQIRPHIDGNLVSYLGPVDDDAKNALLGRAAALLMPILWDEPFGIVMAEALACGTPVVALRRGSVPEVVEHDLTGVIASDIDELVDGIRRVHTFDRHACRRTAAARFSDVVITEEYEHLYRRLLGQFESAELTAAKVAVR